MASKDTGSKEPRTGKGSEKQDDKDSKAQRELGILGPHGDMRLASVIINGYSLELRDRESDGFVGDVASGTAFRHMLDAWRKLVTSMSGKDPFGSKATRDFSKKQLDKLADKNDDAAHALEQAAEDYALQLAGVVQRFMKQPTWRDVERVILGGAFTKASSAAAPSTGCATSSRPTRPRWSCTRCTTTPTRAA